MPNESRETTTPAPRGARRRRSELTRRRIVDAATIVVSSVGISAATVKAIAEEAAVSPSLLLYYFPERQQLLLEALALNERERNQRMALIAADAAPGARLSAAVRMSLPDNAHDREWLFWLGAVEIASFDADAADVVRHLDNTYREAMATLLAGERADRGLVSVSADQLRIDTAFLVAGVDGIANAMMTGMISLQDRDHLIERLLAAALNSN